MPRPCFEEQFYASIRDDSGCLIWSGYLLDGYARYSGQGAYRVAYERFVGPIPPGMTVDHRCFEPACVEPTHLRLLSNLQNARNHRARPGLVPEHECINGHRYTPGNTYVMPNGRRDCRACIRNRVRAYKARKRVEALPRAG